MHIWYVILSVLRITGRMPYISSLFVRNMKYKKTKINTHILSEQDIKGTPERRETRCILLCDIKQGPVVQN